MKGVASWFLARKDAETQRVEGMRFEIANWKARRAHINCRSAAQSIVVVVVPAL